jgi:hypothetical protein
MFCIEHPAKKFLFWCFLIIILLIAFLFYRYSHFLCDHISCVSINQADLLKEQVTYENNFSTYKALWKSPNYLLKVEKNSNISTKDANTLILVDAMRVQGLFDDAQNPYTGEISDEISCDNKYKPEIKKITINNIDITYYSGWMNDRMQYGSCLDDQLVYKAYSSLFYCSNQKILYHLEFIFSLENDPREQYFLSQIQNLKCQNPLSKIGKLFP